MPSGFKTLWQVAWTTSLGVEALRKKVARLRPSKKTKGKEQGWKRIDDFWFLGSSHWDLYICSDSCVLDSQNHFNEFPLSLKPVGGGLLSTVIQTSFQILCFSTIVSETLYSLMRIQFTSILGKSALSVSDCSEEPYWFLSHTKHLHCLCQANPVISSIINQEVLPQKDVTQDPGL